MKEGEEVRDNVLHRIRDEHLVAIELNLVAMHLDVVLNLGEIEHAREVEGIVHVEVNPEERFVLHGIEVAIELLVVLVRECRGRFRPKGRGVVDLVGLFGLHLCAIFPLRLLAKHHGDGEEATIFAQETLDASLFEEFLVVLVNVEDDVRAAVAALGIFDGKFGRAVATPFHGLRSLTMTACDDVYTA